MHEYGCGSQRQLQQTGGGGGRHLHHLPQGLVPEEQESEAARHGRGGVLLVEERQVGSVQLQTADSQTRCGCVLPAGLLVRDRRPHSRTSGQVHQHFGEVSQINTLLLLRDSEREAIDGGLADPKPVSSACGQWHPDPGQCTVKLMGEQGVVPGRGGERDEEEQVPVRGGSGQRLEELVRRLRTARQLPHRAAAGAPVRDHQLRVVVVRPALHRASGNAGGGGREAGVRGWQSLMV